MIPRELATAIEALERVLPGVAVADLPALFGEIERLRVTAWQRMTVPQAPVPAPVGEDRYLTIPEVRARTGLSLSHLYELARTGVLKVKPMGRGGRGYRVLMSDLLAWEARLGTDALDIRLNNMLSSSRDRRRVSAASGAPRVDPSRTRGQNRRPRDHALSMGARGERGPGTRRETDSATAAGPKA